MQFRANAEKYATLEEFRAWLYILVYKSHTVWQPLPYVTYRGWPRGKGEGAMGNCTEILGTNSCQEYRQPSKWRSLRYWCMVMDCRESRWFTSIWCCTRLAALRSFRKYRREGTWGREGVSHIGQLRRTHIQQDSHFHGVLTWNWRKSLSSLYRLSATLCSDLYCTGKRNPTWKPIAS